MRLLTRLIHFQSYEKNPYKKGTVLSVRIERLRPTQFGVSDQGLEAKLKMLQQYVPKGSEVLRTFLQKEMGWVVVGPNRELFLVQGHHMALALFQASVPEMYAYILHDWSDYSRKKFWKKMSKAGLVDLVDTDGQQRKPKELPQSIDGLRRDPYRTLAWLIAETGAYQPVSVPHQQSLWSRFFRKEIQLPERPTLHDYKGAAMLALELANKKKARKLPGYLKLKNKAASEPLFLNRLRHLTG